MLKVQDENQNKSNDPYAVTNLRVSPHSGSHAYTQLRCKRNSLSLETLKGLYLKYPHIEHADISYNNLKTLCDLQYFHHLRWLNASHNKLTAFDLDVEWNIDTNSGNKSLLQLDASFNELTQLKSLSHHQHLEILDLSFNELTQIDALESLHLLHSLNIEHNEIEDLSPLQQLPIVHFNGCNNRITSLDTICAEHIRICNVANNKITDLKCTQKWHQLTEFNIAGNQITDFQTLQHLVDLALLRTLSVERNPIEYINGTLIQNEDVLEDEILWILPDLEVLNGLNVESRTKVESMFNHQAFKPRLDSIARHFQTEKESTNSMDGDTGTDGDSNSFWYRLVEEEFAVCWEGFITKFPYLSTTKIDLNGIKIGNAGLHAICDCIQQCQDLKILNLNGALTQHRWSDTTKPWPLQYLADSLLVFNTIKILDLSQCTVHSINFEPISRMMEQCKYLESLTLSQNNIGQHTLDQHSFDIIKPCPAIKQLTESILKSQSLRVLALDYNNIDAVGAYELGLCLQSEQCPLEELNVSSNPLGLGGNGFGEIANAIKGNQQLKILDISYCIRDRKQAMMMEDVFHSLKQNTKLEHFNISGNLLNDNGIEYLALALKRNNNISTLIMEDVVLDQDGMKMITEALRGKSNLVEFRIDTQGDPQNVATLIGAMSGHLKLESLHLSHNESNAFSKGIKTSQCTECTLNLKSDSVKRTLQRLVSFRLSEFNLTPMDIECLLKVVQETNGELRNLNLSSCKLDQRCWERIHLISNKCPLESLVLSGCTMMECDVDSGDLSKVISDFMNSESVQKSLCLLDLSLMEWNGFDIASGILNAVNSNSKEMVNDENGSRDFCLDLRGITFSGRNLFDTHGFIPSLLNALDALGVKQLKLDQFKVDNSGLEVELTVLDVINEIFLDLAKNNSQYSLSTLSLAGCKLEINELNQDQLSFVNVIGSSNLKHIKLPHIEDTKTLKRLLRNLKGSGIEKIELENVIEMSHVDSIMTSTNQTIPAVTTKMVSGDAERDMDFKVNQFVCSMAYSRCCA